VGSPEIVDPVAKSIINLFSLRRFQRAAGTNKTFIILGLAIFGEVTEANVPSSLQSDSSSSSISSSASISPRILSTS